MSEPSSPSKNSLTGWWKHIKKGESELGSPPPLPMNGQSLNSTSGFSVESKSISSPSPQYRANSPSLLSPLASPTRPFLGYKSRSSHNVRPLSSFQDNGSQEKLKQHRDSFIQQRQMDYIGNSSIFGCPIEESIRVAEAKIYISSDRDGLIRYGRIPRVVALCGSYLKKNGLEVEGIFRVAGSTKRIKELQLIFSSPPSYGSKIDWDGYTVHDAASLFRRFLGSLPEPLIPLSMYDKFREPLRSRPNIVRFLKEKEKKMGDLGGLSSCKEEQNQEQEQLTEDEIKLRKRIKKEKIKKERKEALKDYARLIEQLPELQRQLLFYILDLLAIFNAHCHKNLMPAKNLAAIFQPSVLSHSDHDMSPEEYALSSLVIEFMIEYSYKILPAAQKVSRKDSTLNAPASPTTTEQTNPKLPAPTALLPPPTTKFTRKHSKSLSSVQSPSDMLRVNNGKSKLEHTQTNTTDEVDSALDSAVDTDDETRPLAQRLSVSSIGSQKMRSSIPSTSKTSPSEVKAESPLKSEVSVPTTELKPPVLKIGAYESTSLSSSTGQTGTTIKLPNRPGSPKNIPSSIDDNLSSVQDPTDDERETRSEEAPNGANGEKLSWFKRLRSRSTSKSRR
ncbi:hypothetical protein KL930_000844 [Ogataea haglerorum]|uniref:Rho-GAP domain-containing protein n=1 Tax=Ogataea haglerorum TaxID=1937702 RepID=A0ABQ7RNP1_9ASCO|nr:uncharacterized protein KL911_003527 [Ogataea haglerorum]KAG7700157.1 hypothetical protein KL915_000846 [Ogataea haglerorum]KAG7701814.1 hypothetical protein KL951_000270 [Ogataea haglerorum]KAG7711628.1 hypothetical protein KL914_000270 [Ogataea haglerorum]KAG7712399.1 hypothetical protein KL950_000270 [Ogataea haglerorum]KAG7722451.1 hypothetical protein KL913_000271 [Ogataea haglerorum]